MSEWIYDPKAGRCRKTDGGQAMSRRKTDGERIAATAWVSGLSEFTSQYREKLASDIDRLIRRRMAEAWDDGWFHKTAGTELIANPYRGRVKIR